MNKEEITNRAWKGFEKNCGGTNALLKLAEHAPDKENAYIYMAMWRVGFYYALVSLENGSIGIIDTSKN
jgi:hypothetical protein